MKIKILFSITAMLLCQHLHAAVVAVSAPTSGPVEKWGNPTYGIAILPLDVDGNGTADFQFERTFNLAAGAGPLGSNRIIATFIVGGGGSVEPVSFGDILGPTLSVSVGIWSSGADVGGTGASFDLHDGTAGGLQDKDTYIGIEFQAEDGVHYGWIHYVGFGIAEFPFYDENGELIGYGTSPDTMGGVIKSWAWETEPGVPITAGAVPEANTALLAIAASVGFAALRKRI